MKKFLCILLTLTFIFLCSCTEAESSGSDEINLSSTQSGVSDESNSSSTQSGVSDESNSSSTQINVQPSLVKAINLMASIKSGKVEVSSDMTVGNNAYTRFAVELLKKSLSENSENTLISPLSVIYALGLTANGASGNTLSQMEQIFGMDRNQLNQYLYSYTKMKESESDRKISIANSIWFSDKISPTEAFLQKNADYYNAAAYKSDFSDVRTVSDINNWVNLKTSGMIPNVIEEIDPLSVMFLINALTFEAEWENPYDKNSVFDGEFTLSNGNKTNVEFMHSDDGMYIKDENADGFIKYYKGNYAFVALLPKDGMTVEEYVSTLSGEKVTQILNSKDNFSHVGLDTFIPKFETGYSIEMKELFKSMGMIDAFEVYTANFSEMEPDLNLYIGSIIHKTYISVGELGTKAGAVTVVDMKCESCPMETKQIYLNRPFVYMLLDTTTNTPFFVGTMNNPA